MDRKIPWTIKDVFFVIVTAVVLFLCVFVWLAAVLFLLNFISHEWAVYAKSVIFGSQATAEMGLILIFYASLFAAMDLRIFRRYRISWRETFFKTDHAGRDVIAGIKVYFGFLAVLLLSCLAVYLAAGVWDIVFKTKAVEGIDIFFTAGQLEQMDQTEGLITFVGLIVILMVGPFFEELFFRGCLYGALRSRLNVAWSAVLSAFIFALSHGYLFLLPYVFVLGLILASLVERRRNLISALAFHVLNNTAVMVLTLAVR